MMENSMMKKMGRGMAKAKMAEKAMPAKKTAAKMPAMKMGKVKTSAKPDGLSKVKTKGTMIKMAKGGKAC